ncbi:hypothetical protein [Noviherbaspirillum humi]|uniref:hypothetical protein n=1 Tax=Noviherbaspirillum humi TaxID=1688639 RepID=UPI0011602E18|nr:hypothetical protein [Noviherbaspirillum humi]
MRNHYSSATSSKPVCLPEDAFCQRSTKRLSEKPAMAESIASDESLAGAVWSPDRHVDKSLHRFFRIWGKLPEDVEHLFLSAIRPSAIPCFSPYLKNQ